MKANDARGFFTTNALENKNRETERSLGYQMRRKQKISSEKGEKRRKFKKGALQKIKADAFFCAPTKHNLCFHRHILIIITL